MKHSIKTLLISSLILLINSTIASAAETKSDQINPAFKDKKHFTVIKLDTISHVPAPPRTHRTPGTHPRESLPVAPLPIRSRLPIDTNIDLRPSNSKN